MKTSLQTLAFILLVSLAAHAQVNSGSNGSDGAFNPTTNIVINMADHPDGIYQYTSVNISNGVTVTFIPNANNTPVVWLVQSNCVIDGTVDVSGQTAIGNTQPGNGPGGQGGPGGFAGGDGGVAGGNGQGPGGGAYGQPAAFGTFPTYWDGSQTVSYISGSSPYGNQFLVPLIGGSGGGGNTNALGECGGGGGGGGGGSILIAASQNIQLSGSISANGGGGAFSRCCSFWGCSGSTVGGGGSGGSVRLVATQIIGNGGISTAGGGGSGNFTAGKGRVRFDSFQNHFSGSVYGGFSQGSQFILIPTNGQTAQLAITSVGAVPVSASLSGQLATPDAILSAQQNNPIPIIVHCSNIPLNTQITVSVKPANGAAVSATGLNNTGTLSSSTATVLLNMPRGGGIIYATAATGN